MTAREQQELLVTESQFQEPRKHRDHPNRRQTSVSHSETSNCTSPDFLDIVEDRWAHGTHVVHTQSFPTPAWPEPIPFD